MDTIDHTSVLNEFASVNDEKKKTFWNILIIIVSLFLL